jgi:hypothetical protein
MVDFRQCKFCLNRGNGCQSVCHFELDGPKLLDDYFDLLDRINKIESNDNDKTMILMRGFV